MRIGFVGTGTIAAAMVESFLRHRNSIERIYLSPRSSELAARLSLASFSTVLAAAAHAAPHRGCETLRNEFSTREGINEQGFQVFRSDGWTEGVRSALDAIRRRVSPALVTDWKEERPQ